MKNPVRFWALIFLLGSVIQITGICLFSATSMTRWSQFGQPIALGLTFVALVALLWFAFRNRNKPRAIVPVGVGLGAAYLLAFHVVGIVIFPGLLREVAAQRYWISLIRVFAAAAIIHTALAAAVFGAMRIGWLRTSQVV